MNPRKHKPEPLNFTTKALAHFKHMVSMQGKENKVKLGVKKMGCNGYSYFFEFTSRANKSDHKIIVDDLEFFIPSRFKSRCEIHKPQCKRCMWLR